MHSANEVLDQHLTRPEEEPEEEVAEHKATFLYALKGLEKPESACISLITRTILL
jgi:hypothetical protein